MVGGKKEGHCSGGSSGLEGCCPAFILRRRERAGGGKRARGEEGSRSEMVQAVLLFLVVVLPGTSLGKTGTPFETMSLPFPRIGGGELVLE